jgi:hypothetical protein
VGAKETYTRTFAGGETSYHAAVRIVRAMANVWWRQNQSGQSGK